MEAAQSLWRSRHVPMLSVSAFSQCVSADRRRCLVTSGIGGYKVINVTEVGKQLAGLATSNYRLRVSQPRCNNPTFL